MTLGYNQPLYLLPFDHRHSYVTGMFHATPPLTMDQRQAVIDSKWVIYDGFWQALLRGVPSDCGSWWMRNRATSLGDASSNGYGRPIDRKTRFGRILSNTARIRATSNLPAHFRQSLVRYNPAGMHFNERQTHPTQATSEYCRTAGQSSCSSSWCRDERELDLSEVQKDTIDTSGRH